MTFSQTIIITVLTAILSPLLLKLADGGIKAAGQRFGQPRKNYRELTAENTMLLEAMRQIAIALEDHERFCSNGQDEAAAATIAAMKRDIRPEWRG